MFSFSLQCPGEWSNRILELQLFHDGTTGGNVHYYDLCKVVNHATIAFRPRGTFGRISRNTNKILESDPKPIKNYISIIKLENLIAEFVRQNNIMATWIRETIVDPIKYV